MPRNTTKKFFVQKGRSLNNVEVDFLQPAQFPREVISSLSQIIPTKKEALFGKFVDFKANAKNLLSFEFAKAYAGFLTSAALTSAVLLIFVFNVPVIKVSQKAPDKYTLFAAKPLTLDSLNQDLNFKDSRATRIDNTFKFFKCPIQGYGKKFVEEADINEIPYWVVAAIAFQESSCGKNTPKVDGAETYNAWGWATYGDQKYSFDSWDQGIEVVSKYLSRKFYSRGVSDLCVIMKTYTPPSNGSWCRGVGYFGDFIQSYRTPAE